MSDLNWLPKHAAGLYLEHSQVEVTGSTPATKNSSFIGPMLGCPLGFAH